MIKIPLSRGLAALVDDEDAWVLARKWHARPAPPSTWYAQRHATAEERAQGWPATIYLHRFVLGVLDGRIEVDHRDRDGLNCQRNNLRQATRSENVCNQSRRADNTSGFKGVHWFSRKDQWQAYITIGGRQKSLGYFEIAEDAARAYDAAARIHFGKFARLNFPGPTEQAA